jgi:heme exporter protein B
MLSLLIGLPAITAYVGIAGALLAGRENSSLLSVLLAAPLIIPTLIFGIAAAQSYPQTGVDAAEWRILFGLSLIALAIALPAIIAALLANLE